MDMCHLLPNSFENWLSSLCIILLTNEQTDKQTDRQTDRQTDWQTDWQTDRQTDWQTHSLTD